MGIPENQLETWSHQGSIVQSSDTYATIRRILESNYSAYSEKSYDIFLQGSYGNDSNVYKESDVDIVIKLNDIWQRDISGLSHEETTLYQNFFSNSAYGAADFRRDVYHNLYRSFSNDVEQKLKAITIKGNANRRKADVIAAISYRRYNRFRSLSDQRFDEGICFYTLTGEEIINYPKMHSINFTQKHKNTLNNFKPFVRIIKNIRNRLVNDGVISKDTAPSYFLEGLLYNVPSEYFACSYSSSFVNIINWLLKEDKNKFVCANEQYYLFHESSSVCWRSEQCEKFLSSVVDLWNNWGK
ncbi:nucleotidyltransferase domain-containing protein [Erwinia sorbitola]|uniref:Nucleotidyltransferase n=1 Tax=Erwinia sorbitola TaxID=2681984 RepID=A0ABW9RGC2_9GAMM|nr:nucleotidyltransferase [Erwinia sorbitola]MTD28559.1 nucleotidyltransferase [Erwinia sorbitola]